MPAQESPERVVRVDQTKELFSWKAPVRPFKKRGKDFYTTVVCVAFLLGIIFFVIGGLLPVLVIISFVFLVFVLSSIPPEEVEHKITNKGLIFAGKPYFWDELVRFWFTYRFGNNLLVLDTVRIPGRIELVVDKENSEKITEILSEYVVYEEGMPTFLDKSASWLSKRVPLEA